MDDRLFATLVPLATAAREMRMSRERVLRRLQTGAIRGDRIDGFWYVERTEIDARLDRTSLPTAA